VHPGRASASPLGLCAGLAAIALPGPVAPTHPRRQPRLGLHASPAQWPRAPPMPASHAGSGQPSAEPSLPPRESRQPGPAAATNAGAWLGAGAAELEAYGRVLVVVAGSLHWVASAARSRVIKEGVSWM
jgi:hypothetical protein